MKTLVMMVFLACVSCQDATNQSNPHLREVVISGYTGSAMEPFVSRDGRYLLFNNSNDPATNTDIFYARLSDPFTSRYSGPVRGINTAALEGTPTMDRSDKLYFVSTRSYDTTSCTIHAAQFRDGAATSIQLVDSICRHEPGVVNFDVDIDAAGTTMIYVDSRFGADRQPQTADLELAEWQGGRFVRSPTGASVLAAVNSDALEYAPALSKDGLTLWFTRATLTPSLEPPQIWRARREARTQPFANPVRLEGLGDFVEGPALSPDENWLYFHRRVGSSFHIFAVSVG